MKCVIVSDFHLKINEDKNDLERRIRVESFLKSLLGKIDCLILAGDIFDLWIEWEKVIIKSYFTILKTFSLLKDSGCRLVFLSGNHDFWLDDFLKNKIGFEIYDVYFQDYINNKRVFVSHGDLFTKNDIRYQIYRKLVRLSVTRKLCQLLHPDLCLAIGQKMSRSSRERKNDNALIQVKEAGLLLKAKELSRDYDLIVFGHTHNPVKIDLEKSVYINCGDWIKNSSYCYIDSEKCELLNYTLFKDIREE